MFKASKKDYYYLNFLIKLWRMGKISKYDINMSLGRYFGYPKCCIEHFSKYQEMGIINVSLYMRVMYGPEKISHGYVRCPKCRE